MILRLLNNTTRDRSRSRGSTGQSSSCALQRALACAAKANEQKPDRSGPIYHWFKEGFDTPDLHEARTVLDELA
jgi:hypothetical protein